MFTVALDDQKTHVYSRATGLLVPADPSLEGEVRAQAADNLRQSAIAANILTTAHNNACSTVTKLLNGLNFNPVDLRLNSARSRLSRHSLVAARYPRIAKRYTLVW